MNVFEEEGVVEYLKARNITQPYLTCIIPAVERPETFRQCEG